MARKKITKERVLLTLTEAKKSMDKSEFNSYSFRMQYPEWGQFGCILKKNGVFKKQNQKYFWLSIEPNMNMVDKLLEIYYKKQSINRSNHLEKLSQKKSVIVEEKDVKSTSDLSFDYAEPKTTDSTLSSIMPYESFEIVNTTEFQKLKQTIKDDDELINIQKDIIANKNEKIVGQESYISELEEIMKNYKQNIDAIEKEFVELKNSINNQNNLFIKPNSKKIKVLGIPLYSVEY
jgi:hypothetical protein